MTRSGEQKVAIELMQRWKRLVPLGNLDRAQPPPRCLAILGEMARFVDPTHTGF
jgi:hypothetical protein